LLDNLYNSNGLSAIGLSFDTDWVPDHVLSKVIHELKRFNLSSTWFVTNESPVLDEIAEDKRFEIALHPNFMPSSSHGSNPEEVMRHLKEKFPRAIGVRTHGLVQSSNILRSLSRHGIKYDSSLLLYDTPYLQMHSTFFPLNRLPYIWSDASHLLSGRPFNLETLPLELPGLKILDLHPIHLALNSENDDRYRQLLKAQPELPKLTEKTLTTFVNSSEGIWTLFIDLCNFINQKGIKTHTLGHIHQVFEDSRSESDKQKGLFKPYKFGSTSKD